MFIDDDDDGMERNDPDQSDQNGVVVVVVVTVVPNRKPQNTGYEEVFIQITLLSLAAVVPRM